jgi:hypothetical protein
MSLPAFGLRNALLLPAQGEKSSLERAIKREHLSIKAEKLKILGPPLSKLIRVPHHQRHVPSSQHPLSNLSPPASCSTKISGQ